MKNCLLLLAVVAALAVGAPAYSQYIYLDTNGDAMCSPPEGPEDVLVAGANTVDVWLWTDTNDDGGPATCVNGGTLSLFSYEFILHSTGTVSFGTWAHNSTDLVGYGPFRSTVTGGGDFTVFWGKTFNFDAPGLYKLGTVIATATAGSTLSIASSTPLGSSYSTSFGSECLGTLGLNTIKLGLDFMGTCGASSSTPVNETTWGQIKKLYK